MRFFFKRDPEVLRGGHVNLYLGIIILLTHPNSWSVQARIDRSAKYACFASWTIQRKTSENKEENQQQCLLNIALPGFEPELC